MSYIKGLLSAKKVVFLEYTDLYPGQNNAVSCTLDEWRCIVPRGEYDLAMELRKHSISHIALQKLLPLIDAYGDERYLEGDFNADCFA